VALDCNEPRKSRSAALKWQSAIKRLRRAEKYVLLAKQVPPGDISVFNPLPPLSSAAMPASISLLIAYPKELIRAGLRAMLAGSPVKIVGEASDAPSTVTLAKKHKPAVVLLDAAIPGGDAFELVTKLAKSLSATKFILLSVLDNPTYMARARAVGAANCLLMGFSQRELVTAIENAAAEKPASGGGPFAKVTASMAARDTRAARDAGVTPREEQVLRHIAFGLSNDEIARSLEISVETVKEHVQNLLRKLAVNDRTQAAVWAVKSAVV
jgi:DNA-binding NarL/FixJ family response regulator